MTREERILLERIEKIEKEVKDIRTTLKSVENGTDGNGQPISKPAAKSSGTKK